MKLLHEDKGREEKEIGFLVFGLTFFFSFFGKSQLAKKYRTNGEYDIE